MRLTEQMRLAFRLSGALALVGVLLFGGGGVYLLWSSSSGAPAVAATARTPGETFDRPLGERSAYWGRGEGVTAETVTCATMTIDGEVDEVLPVGPPAGQEALTTITHPELGELVYLASDVELDWTPSRVRCDGPGLEAVFTSPDPRPALHRGLGIALLVFAGVAAVWAQVTLRVTRRPETRSTDGPSDGLTDPPDSHRSL